MGKLKEINQFSGNKTECYIDLLTDLTRQKQELDKKLLQVQTQAFRSITRGNKEGKGKGKRRRRKVYVPRMDNKTILKDAILKVMIPGKEMTMKEILISIKKSKAYKTNSRLFYTMVNNKLHEMADKEKYKDPKIEIPRRGVFVLKS